MQKERGCIKTKLNINLAVLTVGLQKTQIFANHILQLFSILKMQKMLYLRKFV